MKSTAIMVHAESIVYMGSSVSAMIVRLLNIGYSSQSCRGYIRFRYLLLTNQIAPFVTAMI